ncbi:MAG: hypothetical protein D6755_10390, partial [Anaerolineae bacterium]
MTLVASFHDVVGVRVESNSSDVQRFFTAEYARHVDDVLPEALPQVRLRFTLAAAFSVPAGYTLHVHKGLARWGYRIQMDERMVTIDVHGNRMAIPMVHHMLVHPSLRYLAARQGVLMLHAGAVTHDGRSLILTGHGGAGKTTTTSLLLDEGGPRWGLHADDYVFLRPEGESLAYLTRAHLYRSLLRWVPQIKATLSPWERVRLECFGRIRAWSKENIKWPVRLDLGRLWPGHPVDMQAQVGALVVLERAAISTPQVLPISPGDFPLDALLQMNFYEARHFLTLMRKGNVLPDVDSWLDAWRARERALLYRISQRVPVYRLRLPKREVSPALARQHVA